VGGLDRRRRRDTAGERTVYSRSIDWRRPVRQPSLLRMDEEACVVTTAAQVTRKVEEKDAEMAAWKAPAAMLLVQLSNTGMVLLSKVAIDGGMFVLALLTYRSLFGAAIILPIALLRERCVWFFGTSVGWLSSIPIPCRCPSSCAN
jgi:hypothetical protein